MKSSADPRIDITNAALGERGDSILFEETTLRSPQGLSALRDMQALQLKTSEADFRPGLEPQKCVCPKMEEAHDGTNRKQKTYDWMHIYNCFNKLKLHKFDAPR